MILILLYVTFLRNVYVSSFTASLPENVSIDETYVNGFVHGWLFSSLLATTCVTISFCSNLLMVQDKVTGANHDINIIPISKTTIAFAYYLSSLFATLIICYFEMIVGFIIMASTGWFLTFTDVLGIIGMVFLLTNFGTALSSIIHHFLTSQGQMSAVGTLVSSVYGFICGAYMPISQFGEVLQRILGFLPGTYGTVILRHHFQNQVLLEMNSSGNFPTQVTDEIAKNFDMTISVFGNQVPLYVSYIILIASIVVLLFAYAFIVNKSIKVKQPTQGSSEVAK